ncbi:hypothetical protein BG011_003511 [Mortierella polycephala]|uniref:Uncharacterized protein n=1 Tax=Mortierella polycephala TaxID=41804 RepID=A0A9P6Q478_9FUNG|nr:hypothetical protein BG011_003511 [Mortierella polycephala]
MPILYCDPWRAQYFQDVQCPDDATIPIKDWQAWSLFPNHSWIYDKLAVARSQGMDAAPHGVIPPYYPVFSKPIINLRNMGAGSLAIPDEATYRVSLQPGHFWSTLLTGRHVSTDAAILNGEIAWCRHATGITLDGGTFEHWHIHKEVMPELEGYLGTWASKHLAGYTGMTNFETIGGKIIEVHLRFTDQWPDLYGAGWVDAMVRLYSEKRWEFDDSQRQDQYSVVLWGSHGRSYRYPSAACTARVKAEPGVVSVQQTFHENLTPSLHSNPPGGFRLAIVNTNDLEAGRRALKILNEGILASSEQGDGSTRSSMVQLSSL